MCDCIGLFTKLAILYDDANVFGFLLCLKGNQQHATDMISTRI